MKKISLWILILVFTTSLASAQDAAVQQQLDKLSGQIQDLIDMQAQQGKRIDALEKEISDLRDKVNAPTTMPDSASRDDLKKLAEQVQEIDRKRQEDRDLIIKQIENLGKAGAIAPTPRSHKPTSDDTSPAPTPTTPATPQKGYEYVVKQGDTLGLIIKAYREQGVKVTTRQIKAANPNMNPDVLIPGEKIFIPDPNAK